MTAAGDTPVSGPKTLLLAGVSVRMLAQSAARTGIRPVSLDWFADLDTEECSAVCRTVSDGNGFDAEKLLRVAARYAPPDGGSAFVYGGGFEGRTDLLDRLASGRVLCGNLPETVHRLKTPGEFLGLLDKLGIPYPEIRWLPPEEPAEAGAWLTKQGASQGGLGVCDFRSLGSPPPAGTYFQRKLAGIPHSALFLANGLDARILGFNTLWTSDHLQQTPFLFAGARSHFRLRQRQRTLIRGYVRALTRALSLVGINSLDFMIDHGEIRVLEINPRPSATMALYDPDYPEGLLAYHREACLRGRLGPIRRVRTVRGFRILYAGRSMRMPPGFRWPDWCGDRPRAGTRIRSGQPFCSIRAESDDPRGAALEQQLSIRERRIRSSLMF